MGMRAVVVALMAIGLAACVTASNTLSTDQVESFGYAGVKVTFAPNATIWWGDGERAYAASKGLPATESEALAKTPEGQAYLRNAIASRVKTSADRYFTSTLNGTRPVRFEIVVTNVTIASGIQRVVLGGHHSMTADTTVVDAKTGAVLLPYPGQSAMALAGQGVAGVLIDAALLSDPIDRVVDDYMGQYARWFLRR
jgi:hypothetical protein